MKKEENNLTVLLTRFRFKSYFLQIIYGSHYHHHYHPISSCPKLLEPILMEHRVSNNISYLGHSFCTLDWFLWQWQRFILNICMGRNYVGSSYLYLKYGWDYYSFIHIGAEYINSYWLKIDINHKIISEIIRTFISNIAIAF